MENTPTEQALKPALVSVPAAAKYLGGLSRATIYNIKDRLEWVRIGARSFVTVRSLDALIAASSDRAA